MININELIHKKKQLFTLRNAAKLSIAPDRTSSKSNTRDSNVGKRSFDVASSPI